MEPKSSTSGVGTWVCQCQKVISTVWPSKGLVETMPSAIILLCGPGWVVACVGWVAWQSQPHGATGSSAGTVVLVLSVLPGSLLSSAEPHHGWLCVQNGGELPRAESAVVLASSRRWLCVTRSVVWVTGVPQVGRSAHARAAAGAGGEWLLCPLWSCLAPC